MAVDFKDLETRLVSNPVRLRRAARRAQTPTVLEPSQVVVLPPASPEPDLVVSVPTQAVTQSRAAAPVDDVPATSYWVRRRRAEAQASDQA